MNQKQDWVDFIRVLSVFAVVLLHAAFPLLYKYREIPVAYWMAANLYDSAARMCVPVLFMLSGALLLGKTEPLAVFFGKRINKVVIPLLWWSAFYLLWRKFFEHQQAISWPAFFRAFLQPAYYHLWFLYSMIGLYLCVPIMRVWVRAMETHMLYYFLLLWAVAVSMLPFVEKVTGTKSGIELKMVSGFMGYMVIGHVAARARLAAWMVSACGLVCAICIAATAAGTYYLTARSGGRLDEYLYGYTAPNVLLFSVAAFLLLKYLGEESAILKSPPFSSCIKALSPASFGIYLIHPAFYSLFASGKLGFSVAAANGNPMFGIPAAALTVFLCSFATVFLLQKIPLLKTSTP